MNEGEGMRQDDGHLWVRRRLAAWRAGVLEELEAARVDAHLAACAECRELADAYDATPTAEAGTHIAASLVSEWPRAQRSLRGMERTLVRRDRKSTRLNSSHLGISYAVFCLKKKNKEVLNYQV